MQRRNALMLAAMAAHQAVTNLAQCLDMLERAEEYESSPAVSAILRDARRLRETVILLIEMGDSN